MTTRERILQAVDDENWQRFRLSLKGISTKDKLQALQRYYVANVLDQANSSHPVNEIEDVCIRVDNYIKALCRGGQLYPGESLQTALKNGWKLRIKR